MITQALLTSGSYSHFKLAGEALTNQLRVKFNGQREKTRIDKIQFENHGYLSS